MPEQVPDPSWGGADWSETGRQLEESGKLQHSPDLTKMMRTVRVLIVGGGATGQVYGFHLSEAGVHVTMFVKPKYAPDLEDGCALHCYGVAGKRPKKHFQPDELITDLKELREHTYDQVWLCVPSPALRDGFLERLHRECITAAIWVTFQPELDWEVLTATIPPERIVGGTVNFIAYRAPLAGEELWPEGVAYFIPPWSMTKFSGNTEDEENLYPSAVANALQLRTGSLVAAVVPDTAAVARVRHTVVLPFVLAMESLDWSLAALQTNTAVLELLRNAVIELQLAAERETKKTIGRLSVAQKPWFWKVALTVAPYVTAFPLEGYLRYHFTKLREQTDERVDQLIELCGRNEVAPVSFKALCEQWRSRRGQIASLDPGEYDTQTGHRLSVATPVPAAVPDEDRAASSVEFRTDTIQDAASQAGAEDSQGFVIGSVDVSTEFESEDTPPPPGQAEREPGDETKVPSRPHEVTPLPAGILPVPDVTDGDGCEREDTPMPAAVRPAPGIKNRPAREQVETPMPAAILPVPGFCEDPISLARADSAGEEE